MKPFLAPLCSCAAAVPGGEALKLPLRVSPTLSFRLDTLSEGSHMVRGATPEVSAGELFRTASNCVEDFVVLAGWETLDGTVTVKSRWFSLSQVP